MAASNPISWSQRTFPSPEGTIACRFRAHADGRIFDAVNGSANDAPLLICAIEHDALRVRATTPRQHVDLDIEDTTGITDGAMHTFALTFGEFGTRVYLDGSQCFSGTANLCPTTLTGTDGPGQGAIRLAGPSIDVTDMRLHAAPLTSESIAALTPRPAPDIDFAAAQLAPRDVRRVRALRSGTIFMHFRVRGPRQYGTLLAAGERGEERLAVSIDEIGRAHV